MKFLKEYSYYFFLLTAWLFAICIAWPTGEFPLNDDWTYAATVKHFCETGTYRTGNVPAMTLFGHVLWGSLFAKTFGFSFTILRISGSVAGFLGVVFTYRLINYLCADKKTSFLAALILVANPVYFSLSNTFMTDIPFFACSVISLFYYVRYLREGKNSMLLWAILFSCYSVLIRQTGIVIPLAVSFLGLWENRKNARLYFSSALPALSAGIVLILFTWWLKKFNQPAEAFQGAGSVRDYLQQPMTILSNLSFRTRLVLLYAGLFLFPLILISVLESLRKTTSWQKLIAAGIFVTSLYSLFRVLWSFPYENIFNEYGIGPLTTFDSLVAKINLPSDLPVPGILVVKILSLMGGAALVTKFYFVSFALLRKEKDFKSGFSRRIVFCACVCIAIFSGLCALPDFFFDRYVLFLLPAFLLVLLFPSPALLSRVKFIFSFGFILAMLFFSAIILHDYFSWQRCRWQAGNFLLQQGIKAENIEGGYEFNGWTAYLDTGGERGIGWHRLKKEYMISNGNYPDYEKTIAFTYKTFFPVTEKKIYLLKRQNAKTTRSPAE
jgi:4-amino-4-deoxy-L-arabinose transferase-like glycosyltransferase